MASASSHQVIEVKRCDPELVVPAKPTPREFKKLSDVDSQEGMRSNLTRTFWFYKNNNKNPSMEGKDPVKVIREALGRALVYYYPFAGRLKEGSDRKLLVDCNGQGVLFTEANADVMFEQLGHTIQPPFPFNLDEILYNVPGSDGIIGCPLLLIQVTRLKCGSFILGVRINHTVCDAFGTCQFMNAVGEMARGAQHPSVPPVWQRELLDARNPPRISTRINHDQYQQETGTDLRKYIDQTGMVQYSFVFTSNQIKAIRKHLPPHLASSSQFELLTACIWRCRTLALNLDPEEVVQVTCVFSVRGKNFGLNLPLGYYGNAVAFPAAASKAGVLCKSPLGYAVELVKKAKSEMNVEQYTGGSAVDLMLFKGRPAVYIEGNYFVSDLTKVGFEEIDFGWGFPEYAAPPMSYPFNCYYIKYRRSEREGDDGDGILVPICLPLMAMERFQQELKEIIEGSNTYKIILQPTANIKAML